MALQIGVDAPWVISWSEEESFDIRPCRWVEGRLAVWQPHRSGSGRPLFARPHSVRQRKAIRLGLCSMCGEPIRMPTAPWWFGLGVWLHGGEKTGPIFMTQEPGLHRACAVRAAEMCPHLKARHLVAAPMPIMAADIAASIVGGEACERDFGIRPQGRTVHGALKLAWRGGHLDDQDLRVIERARK